MTLVAISAAYGAGGSQVGPGVARRLGIPFVDRAIPLAVAEQLEVPLEDAEAHDAKIQTSWIERLLRGYVGADTGNPVPVPGEITNTEDFRRATEDAVRQQAAGGHAVILGRAGAILLREDPRALRGRLTGSAERRIEQTMRLGGLDRKTAERAPHHTDRAYAEYARNNYGVSLDDPALFHMMIDSTLIPLEACVELIATAAGALAMEVQA
jgi:cytidylate kinase